MTKTRRATIRVQQGRFARFTQELDCLNPILQCIGDQLRALRQDGNADEDVTLRIKAYFTQVKNRQEELMEMLALGRCGACHSEETERRIRPADSTEFKYCRECRAIEELEVTE